MNNNFKRELEKIDIPENVHERAKRGVLKAKSEKPNRFLKKAAITVVASSLLLSAVGVGATQLPSMNHLVSIVSPEIALMLQPVEVSSESNGIKMEVIAAMNDEEMAVFYVTLQDLSQNRIDDTLDLYNYSFTGTRMLSSEIVDYNEETNTATLRIQANGGEELNDKKVNFRLDSFLSHKRTYEGKVELELAHFKNLIPETVPLDMNNIPGGSGGLFYELESQGTIPVLKPDQMEVALPEVDFVNISNVGMVEDRLHIQTRWTGEGIDDHGYLYFVDEAGNEIVPSSIHFGADEAGNTNYGREYTEYIFNANRPNFEELQLMGRFVRNDKYITGNWSTTFHLQPIEEERDHSFVKEYETWTTSRVNVSPLGITLYGNGIFDDSNDIEVSAHFTDGTVVTFDSMNSVSEDGDVIVKFIANLPLDLSKIESIAIDGENIEL